MWTCLAEVESKENSFLFDGSEPQGGFIHLTCDCDSKHSFIENVHKVLNDYGVKLIELNDVRKLKKEEQFDMENTPCWKGVYLSDVQSYPLRRGK